MAGKIWDKVLEFQSICLKIYCNTQMWNCFEHVRSWMPHTSSHYVGSFILVSRPGKRLSWLSFSWLYSVTPPRNISGYHSHFIPKLFQFIIHSYPTFRLLHNLSYWQRHQIHCKKIYSKFRMIWWCHKRKINFIL